MLATLYQPQRPIPFYPWYRAFVTQLIAFGQILFLNICRYHYAILLPSLDCGQADPLMVTSVIWSDDNLNAEGKALERISAACISLCWCLAQRRAGGWGSVSSLAEPGNCPTAFASQQLFTSFLCSLEGSKYQDLKICFYTSIFTFSRQTVFVCECLCSFMPCLGQVRLTQFLSVILKIYFGSSVLKKCIGRWLINITEVVAVTALPQYYF